MIKQERLKTIYERFNTYATRQKLLQEGITPDDIMDLKRDCVFVTSKRGAYAINRTKLVDMLGITEPQDEETKELTEREKLEILKNGFRGFATRECLDLFGFSELEIRELHKDRVLDFVGDNKFLVDTNIIDEKLQIIADEKENKVYTIPEDALNHPSLDLTNDFGLKNFWIVEYLFSSEVALPVIFEQLDYTEEEAEIACLLMARKYYANGMYRLGDLFVSRITEETAITPFVSWLRKEIVANRNDFSETVPEKHFAISPLSDKNKK